MTADVGGSPTVTWTVSLAEALSSSVAVRRKA
jgi:hypothetical protein